TVRADGRTRPLDGPRTARRRLPGATDRPVLLRRSAITTAEPTTGPWPHRHDRWSTSATFARSVSGRPRLRRDVVIAAVRLSLGAPGGIRLHRFVEAGGDPLEVLGHRTDQEGDRHQEQQQQQQTQRRGLAEVLTLATAVPVAAGG